jgi:hypothetical protein
VLTFTSVFDKFGPIDTVPTGNCSLPLVIY